MFCHSHDLETNPRTLLTKNLTKVGFLYVMFFFSLEKDSFEDEFLFIKILGLEMIKLVYLEFRLGLEFSCPCVKRDVTEV